MSENIGTLSEVNEIIREQLKRLKCKQLQSQPKIKTAPGLRKCNKCKLWFPMEVMQPKKYKIKTVWICNQCLVKPDGRRRRK